MPEFVFKKSTAVVVGTFNIYVLQPSTLKAMGLVESGQQVLVRSDLTAPGITFDIGGVKWTVRPDRVVLETTNTAIDLGHKLYEVLGRLMWTPIVAIGLNTEFELNGEATGFGEITLPTIGIADGVATAVSVKHGELCLLNINLSRKDGKHTLLLNAHHELSSMKEAPEDSNKMAREVCASFFEVREKMTLLAKTLLDTELNYA